MTTTRNETPKPDPQGDDLTQPSKSPGEIEGDAAKHAQQGGNTGPQGSSRNESRPRRNENPSPRKPGQDELIDDEDEIADDEEDDDEDLPQRDPENVGSGRREGMTE